MWPCLEGWSSLNFLLEKHQPVAAQDKWPEWENDKEPPGFRSFCDGPKLWPCNPPSHHLSSTGGIPVQPHPLSLVLLLGCWCPSLPQRQAALVTGSTPTLEEVTCRTGPSSVAELIANGIPVLGSYCGGCGHLQAQLETISCHQLSFPSCVGVMKEWMVWVIRIQKV